MSILSHVDKKGICNLTIYPKRLVKHLSIKRRPIFDLRYSNIKTSERRKTSPAFTIVELLIVIAIIGILAAITIVSYIDITARANQASLQSDLANASNQLKMYQVENSTYPVANNCPTPGAGEICLKNSSGNSYLYTANNNSSPQTFSLYATKGTTRYRVTNDVSPVPATQVVASGGTVTNIGGYRIHTFTTGGTFTVTSGDNVEVLVVAGGGGGGSGDCNAGSGTAGGGGGLLYNPSYLITPGTYTATVGGGGATNNNGGVSSFGSITATGGGRGGIASPGCTGGDLNSNGANGGSGGSGQSYYETGYVGGVGISGQGNSGAFSPGYHVYNDYLTGGGGGAGSSGGNVGGYGIPGAGGIGGQYSISGAATYYAGGGGGASYYMPTVGAHGAGIIGGGGSAGGAGNIGIIIIRYPN